jgi:hypothetical protein
MLADVYGALPSFGLDAVGTNCRGEAADEWASGQCRATLFSYLRNYAIFIIVIPSGMQHRIQMHRKQG